MNCSPGATFAHINMGMKGVGIPRDAEYVIIVCGTNYFQNPGAQIELEMRRLISTINNLSPNVKVSFSQWVSFSRNLSEYSGTSWYNIIYLMFAFSKYAIEMFCCYSATGMSTSSTTSCTNEMGIFHKLELVSGEMC